jgi:hypothetical protein
VVDEHCRFYNAYKSLYPALKTVRLAMEPPQQQQQQQDGPDSSTSAAAAAGSGGSLLPAIISPSILAADFANLAQEVNSIQVIPAVQITHAYGCPHCVLHMWNVTCSWQRYSCLPIKCGPKSVQHAVCMQAAGADWVHIDTPDSIFVPNSRSQLCHTSSFLTKSVRTCVSLSCRLLVLIGCTWIFLRHLCPPLQLFKN